MIALYSKGAFAQRGIGAEAHRLVSHGAGSAGIAGLVPDHIGGRDPLSDESYGIAQLIGVIIGRIQGIDLVAVAAVCVLDVPALKDLALGAILAGPLAEHGIHSVFELIINSGADPVSAGQAAGIFAAVNGRFYVLSPAGIEGDLPFVGIRLGKTGIVLHGILAA